MDCRQIRSLFTAYQDREIDHRKMLPFEHHLAACPQCAREWQDFQKTLRLLQGVTPMPVPSDLLPGIHEKLARRNFGARLQRLLEKIFPPVPLTAAASLTAAALAVTLLIKTDIVFRPEAPAIAPQNRTARMERPEARRPPLVTMPVSLGRTAADYADLAPRVATPERHSYYQSLLEREGNDFNLLASWHDHLAAANDQRPAAGTTTWQIGPPLVPDVIIRVPHLSSEGMKWLHSRIELEGRWQTRLYPHDYFLVLLDPGELSTLYNLLQRQHLSFSTHSLPESERVAQKPLLVAVRP